MLFRCLDILVIKIFDMVSSAAALPGRVRCRLRACREAGLAAGARGGSPWRPMPQESLGHGARGPFSLGSRSQRL